MEIPRLIDKFFLSEHFGRSMYLIRKKVFTDEVIQSFMPLEEWRRTKTFTAEQSAAIKKILLEDEK